MKAGRRYLHYVENGYDSERVHDPELGSGIIIRACNSQNVRVMWPNDEYYFFDSEKELRKQYPET